MCWTIIKKELLENFYSFKFRVVAILTVLLMILSSLVLINDYQKRLDDYFINQPKLGESRVAVKPSILSLYFTGLGKGMEKGYDIIPGTVIMLPSATILKLDFISTRFPVPDIGYIVKIILSLLAMVIAFDAFCGEKTKGTLRLLLSNNISRNQLILGKIVGNLLSLLIPFTFAFLLGIIVIIFFGNVVTLPDSIRILLFFIGSILYLTIFILLAITISSSTKLPSTSLVICLVFWAFLTFGIPNLIEPIARAISPYPSPQSLEEEKVLTFFFQEGILQSQDEKKNKAELFEELEQKENSYRNLLNKYTSTAKMLSRFSPIGPYTFFASNITNSGVEDEQNFKRSLLQYKGIISRQPEMRDKIIFNYKPNTLDISLENSAVDIWVLLIFIGLLLTTASLSFYKYDVR